MPFDREVLLFQGQIFHGPLRHDGGETDLAHSTAVASANFFLVPIAGVMHLTHYFSQGSESL